MTIHDSPLEVVHNAYRRLTRNELILFLKVRNLPTTGSDADLASRLTHHDLHTYHFPSSISNGRDRSLTPTISLSDPTKKSPQRAGPELPIEIIAEILEHVGDWELAKAVGVPTSLSCPPEWLRASDADHALFAGHIPAIEAIDFARDHSTGTGAIACIRFGYLHVLEYLLSQHRDVFVSLFLNDMIPIHASRHGRTSVLSWWQHAIRLYPDVIKPPKSNTIPDAIDDASRFGQVASLDWWLSSGFPFEYTEAALEYASTKKQIAVLEWWKQNQKELPLKIGRVMDMASTAGHVDVLEWWATSQLEFKYDRSALHHASCHGKIEVLNWWLGSGLQLKFDQEALIGATRHNRPEVLEWWDKCGLPIQYRMCDVEEALEDAILGGEAARQWWKRKGVDFNATNTEWTKLQNLN